MFLQLGVNLEERSGNPSGQINMFWFYPIGNVGYVNMVVENHDYVR
jgi:hypothetical protein